MNKSVRTACVLALFACALSVLVSPARGQSVYGSIFGTVADKNGGAIPGATITVTDVSKGTVFTVLSNATGDYTVPHLIPDIYNIRVTAKGFKAFETTGIQVEADAAPRIDASLEVGGATETVQVNADQEPVIKTDRADVATVFNEQQVSSLPVGDQNFTNLQLLLPGAQKLGWSHAADENPQASQQIQVDGQAFGGTAFELDGSDNQDPILGIIVINPALDAVTETKISTQNYDAELGKAVSAVVTAQTRSGTNRFHGDVYNFRTGNANIARDPYTQPPTSVTSAEGLPASVPPGLKNRFGASIGGPFIRNRGFFFFNYEGQRQKVGVSNTNAVPTVNMMNSCMSGNGCDFSDYLALLPPGSGTTQLIYNQVPDPAHPGQTMSVPFPGNVIPNDMLSQPALNLLKLLQPYTPNRGVAGSAGFLYGNYAASGTGLFNSNQWTQRVDYTFNERMHAFERFSRFTDILSGNVMFGDAGGPGFGLGSPPYGGNSNGANDSLAGGMDIAINPKLLTDFRLGYYRYNIIDTKFDQGSDFATQLGIPGINLGDNFTSGAPGFIMHFSPLAPADNAGSQALVGGGLGINRCNCPLTEREDQFQIVNNWTKIMGNHTLKVGADLRYARNLRVPSDTDRAGQMDFKPGPTSDNGSLGLAWASFMLGEPSTFGRYVGNAALDETNAKEFQKRTFFYAQDTWRVTRALMLNLGVRYELYFPETVNGAGHGSLLNLTDGYMHIAGVGGIPTNMGWGLSYGRQFAPRIGLTYQFNSKAVVRAGYGRSFDTGVFGSIFGHVVTQNLPVLANQQIPAPSTTGFAFSLPNGPPPNVFPAVPSNGLLPAPGYAVSPKARPNPLRFPTIDAWNLAVQQSVTPTLSFTIAYVGNKGTHTLGDGDNNNTNPNEAGLVLPAQYSVTGQTLHFDNTATGNTINPDGGVSNPLFLQRYYGGSLPACKDPLYATPTSKPYITPGMCGWTNGVGYYSNDLNTEFDALQLTVTQQMKNGLAFTANYQWASAFDQISAYSTWSKSVVHQRDANVRKHQFVWYGSYDLPFGHGKQFGGGVNHAMDLLIGGYQLSGSLNWANGLPFSISFSDFGTSANPLTCAQNVGNTTAPCRPNTVGHMKTQLSSPIFLAGGTKQNTFWTPQPALFSFPGLGVIGNAGANTYWGPGFFSSNMAFAKQFNIWPEWGLSGKFRMDAFNVFNHTNAANPSSTDVLATSTPGLINSNANGCVPNGDCGPRQLVFSLRVEF
jgi:Carboxypeptidase regulatory-like domain